MKKIIYNTFGMISLGLGILGAFLPLLPSTCFILFATWAFSKSSPTFHAWLYYKSPFATSIQNWQQHKVIPTNVKWMACVSIVISYSITAYLVNNTYILVGVGLGLLIVIAYLITKPSRIGETTFQPRHELHQPIRKIHVF